MRSATIAFLCCIFSAAGAAQAGTTGSVTGFVRDEKGAPIADAVVRIIAATDAHVARTDYRGFFTFMTVRPDTFTISIEKRGFRPLSRAGFLVAADVSNRVITSLEKAMNVDFPTGPPPGPDQNLVNSDRSWDSYVVPRFLIEAQIP
jgi:hypothetical protein